MSPSQILSNAFLTIILPIDVQQSELTSIRGDQRYYSILNLSTGWMSVANITARPLYPQERTPISTGGWVGPTAGQAIFENRRISFPYRDSNPDRQFRRLVTGPTELPWLLDVRPCGLVHMYQCFRSCHPERISNPCGHLQPRWRKHAPPETSVPNYILVFTAPRISDPNEIGFGRGNCFFFCASWV